MSKRRVHLVSTMKNEGPYILEWIAYHHSIGITDFTIFSNDCTDGSNLILNRLDHLGIINHFDNPLSPGMDPQRRAYSRAGKMEQVRSSEWVLIIDADEFLNVRIGDHSVDALIEASGEVDAISINWRLMGSSDHAHWHDGLVTERFTHGSTFDEPENGLVWGFKTLFRPERFDFFGVHRPKFFKDRKIQDNMAKWVNGSGKEMGGKILTNGWRSSSANLGYEFAQVNHYAIKSREEFLLKRLRGTANSKDKDRIDMDYWNKYDLNANEDSTIPTQAIQSLIDRMLTDEDLAALTRACKDSCDRTLALQMEEPELFEFVKTGTFTPKKKRRRDK